MQVNSISKKHLEIRYRELFFLAFFVFSILIKIIASIQTPVNTFEGERLLHLSGMSTGISTNVSVIESVLVKSTFLLFGYESLAARIWPIFVGSSIFLLPVYLKKKLDWKPSLLFSILLILDPFLAVNSIQTGSNIFSVVSTVFLLAAIIKKDIPGFIISLVVLFLSGRGAILGFIILGGILLSPRFRAVINISDFINEIRKKVSDKPQQLKLGILISLACLILFGIFEIKISNILPVYSITDYWQSTLQNNINLFANVLSLPIYLPLFFSILIFAIGSLKIRKIEGLIPFIIALVLAFVLIVSNPNNQVFGMVWISMMLVVLSCALLSGRLKELSLKAKKELLVTLAFSILLASLSISIGQFVYAGFNNLAQTNALLGVITSILLLVIAGVSTFYFFGKKTMGHHLFLSVMFLLLIFQATAITRTHGFGGNSALEPIFPGEKPDVDTVAAQIESFSYTKEFVEESPSIATVSINNPAIIWGLRDYEVDQFPSHLNPITGYEFVITENENIESKELYLGQEFIMASFPAWTTKPLEKLATYDFWSWVFTRDAKMIKKSAVIWMKK